MALSWGQNVNIMVHQLDQPAYLIECPVAHTAPKVIHVSYHDGQHYNSVWGANQLPARHGRAQADNAGTPRSRPAKGGGPVVQVDQVGDGGDGGPGVTPTPMSQPKTAHCDTDCIPECETQSPDHRLAEAAIGAVAVAARAAAELDAAMMAAAIAESEELAARICPTAGADGESHGTELAVDAISGVMRENRQHVVERTCRSVTDGVNDADGGTSAANNTSLGRETVDTGGVTGKSGVHADVATGGSAIKCNTLTPEDADGGPSHVAAPKVPGKGKSNKAR